MTVDYRRVRCSWDNPKALARKNLAAAVAVAQTAVATFDPEAEYMPSAVRIVRIGWLLGEVLEATPEVAVLPCYVEVFIDGGNPDFSPATPHPDPVPWGEQGWVRISTLREAFSPASLVQVAERSLGCDGVHAVRICRDIGDDDAQVVWSRDRDAL